MVIHHFWLITIDARCATGYNYMIKTWKHMGLRKFYNSGDKSGIIARHYRRLNMILQLLDAANSEQLNLPGLGFHKLKGNLKNFYAVTVRANW